MGRLACEKGLSLLTDFGWASADVRMYVHTHTHSQSISHAEQQRDKDSADEGQTAVQQHGLSPIKLCSLCLYVSVCLQIRYVPLPYEKCGVTNIVGRFCYFFKKSLFPLSSRTNKIVRETKRCSQFVPFASTPLLCSATGGHWRSRQVCFL